MQYLHSTDRLGGAVTANEIVDNVVDNLFDEVSGVEHFDGDTEYRCFFLSNNTGLHAFNVKIWIESNTDAVDDTVEIGAEPSGGTPAQSIVNESMAPSGVSFFDHGFYSQLVVGDIAEDAVYAIWVKRIVSSGFVEENLANKFTLRVSYDSYEYLQDNGIFLQDGSDFLYN